MEKRVGDVAQVVEYLSSVRPEFKPQYRTAIKKRKGVNNIWFAFVRIVVEDIAHKLGL
jgi:hypothetical protein